MRETFFYNSPVGTLAITCNTHAVESLLFTDAEPAAKNFSNPALPATVPAFETSKKCLQQLDDYFAGKNFLFTLNIRQSGTDFQQAVWSALSTIKPGTTISYLQLSRQLGNTKAIRAAGTANGKNKVAIIIPCHRVIGSNGKMVGYAGGLWRKQWLLEHEAKFLAGMQLLF